MLILVLHMFLTLSFIRLSTKPHPQATSAHQLKIDSLLSRNEAHMHIVKTTPSDDIKTDILAESPTVVAADDDVSNQCCGQVSYSDDIGDDVIDCLFDDIDYLDKFLEPEPFPSDSHHGNTTAELNSESEAMPDVIPVVSHDDSDDVIELSSVSSCGK